MSRRDLVKFTCLFFSLSFWEHVYTRFEHFLPVLWRRDWSGSALKLWTFWSEHKILGMSPWNLSHNACHWEIFIFLLCCETLVLLNTSNIWSLDIPVLAGIPFDSVVVILVQNCFRRPQESFVASCSWRENFLKVGCIRGIYGLLSSTCKIL